MASEKAILARIISRWFTLTFNRYAVWKRNATGILTLPMSRPFFARVSCECVFIRACARWWASAYCCEIITALSCATRFILSIRRKSAFIWRDRQKGRSTSKSWRKRNGWKMSWNEQRRADERDARPRRSLRQKLLIRQCVRWKGTIVDFQ